MGSPFITDNQKSFSTTKEKRGKEKYMNMLMSDKTSNYLLAKPPMIQLLLASKSLKSSCKQSWTNFYLTGTCSLR